MTIHESSCLKSGSGYGPAAWALAARRSQRIGAGDRRGAEAHDEQARTLEEVPSGDRPVPLLQQFFDLFRNVREGRHATTSLSEAAPAAAIDVAARLMAA